MWRHYRKAQIEVSYRFCNIVKKHKIEYPAENGIHRTANEIQKRAMWNNLSERLQIEQIRNPPYKICNFHDTNVRIFG